MIDEHLAAAFDAGAASHERGESREVGVDDIVPYFRDAWLAGWDASAFYGLQRSLLCRDRDCCECGKAGAL